MKYIRRASAREKEEMIALVALANSLEKREPSGCDDEHDDVFPVSYRLEHTGGDWQMMAYTPDGKRMDSSWNVSMVRCPRCGCVNTYDGDSPECGDCGWSLWMSLEEWR